MVSSIDFVLPTHIKHILDDVLKARLKTVGVSEYKFEMEVSVGKDTGTEWRIVDVGGSRSQVKHFSACTFAMLTNHFSVVGAVLAFLILGLIYVSSNLGTLL